MSRHLQYQTQGTCSRLIDIVVSDEGVIEDVQFVGGCHGNLQGICALVKGQKAAEVRDKLIGIRCGTKPTSCPDQLATALGQLL
jgi:uncharacterized protein (TIGR03905 family)